MQSSVGARSRQLKARKVLPVVATVVSLAAAAGCGSSSSGSSAGGTSGSPAAASTTIDAAVGAQYSGGTVGKAATLSPITIGWIMQQGGTPSNPEGTVAFDAALKYINTNLDGVDGHPIQTVKCFIVSTTAQAQACAQKMLSDSSVVAVALGSTSLGNQELYQTLGGKKPVVVGNANPGPDVVSANTYALNSGPLSGVASTAAYLKQIKATSVSMIADSQPTNLSIAQNIARPIKGEGIKVDLATFPVNSTDLTTALTAAKIGSTSASVPGTVSPPECIAYAKAMQQLGATEPTIAANSCITSSLKSALGDYPKWTYASPYLNIAAPDPTGQVAFYKAVMAKEAGSSAELGIDAPYTFGQAFAIAKMLNDAKATSVTATSFAAAAKAFPGPVLLGARTIKYGVIPVFRALGSAEGRMYTYQGNGKWQNTTGWIGGS